jgi:hypothetical protein
VSARFDANFTIIVGGTVRYKGVSCGINTDFVDSGSAVIIRSTVVEQSIRAVNRDSDITIIRRLDVDYPPVVAAGGRRYSNIEIAYSSVEYFDILITYIAINTDGVIWPYQAVPA